MWYIGDGTTVNAWDIRWIDQDVRIDDMDIHIPMHIKTTRVVDFTSEDGEWNWEILSRWLSENLLCIIVSMLPPSTKECLDTRAGISVNCSKFSVGAMYNLLDEDDNHRKDDRWIEIWKFQNSERIQSFIWMLNHDGLLTNSGKNGTGLMSIICNFYGDVEVYALHVLRDCPLTMDLWLSEVHTNMRFLFFADDLKKSIHSNMQNNMWWNNNDDLKDFWATTYDNM